MRITPMMEFIFLQILKKRSALLSEDALLFSLILTLLVTPYLRAYDLILLIFPAFAILEVCAEKNWDFLQLYVAYFAWVMATIGLIFLAVQLNHDIWSVLLTISVSAVFSYLTLFAKKKEQLPFPSLNG